MVRPKVALALLLSAVQLVLAAQTTPAKEYQLKAAFLYNFASFAQWPAGAFQGPDAPMVIGVLGDNPFGTFLDDAVHGEMIGGRPVTVRFYHSVNEVKDCQILFICASEEGRMSSILESLRGRKILTVSDVEAFARRGGVIQFATEHNRIHLKINLLAANQASVELSSKLLRSAEIINGKS